MWLNTPRCHRPGLVVCTATLACLLLLLQVLRWPGPAGYPQHHGTRLQAAAEQALEGDLLARVLLLTYMRAGSTFTAELLTLHPVFNYLFEPLWRFKNIRTGFSAAEMQASEARYLTALFDCDPLTTVETLRHEFVNRVRFELLGCRQRPLLAKVIRARGGTVRELLELNPRLKIIHLVRDPRGVVVSRGQVGAKDSAAGYCQEIREDLTVTDQLRAASADRYARVRYEDLADRRSISAELSRLYRFMGVALPEQRLQAYMESHYEQQNGNRTGEALLRRTTNLYGTKKRADFDPHRWKKQLTEEQIRNAESECWDVMERFGYEVPQR